MRGHATLTRDSNECLERKVLSVHAAFWIICPNHKSAFLQLLTSADNVTLLAFAADRRAAVRRRLLQQSIDISCPRGPQQQTRHTLL